MGENTYIGHKIGLKAMTSLILGAGEISGLFHYSLLLLFWLCVSFQENVRPGLSYQRRGRSASAATPWGSADVSPINSSGRIWLCRTGDAQDRSPAFIPGEDEQPRCLSAGGRVPRRSWRTSPTEAPLHLPSVSAFSAWISLAWPRARPPSAMTRATSASPISDSPLLASSPRLRCR